MKFIKKNLWWLAICGTIILVGLSFRYQPKLLGAYFPALQFLDANSGTVKSAWFDAEGLRVTAQTYLQALVEGDISGHTPFVKFGRVTGVNASEVDVIPWTAAYVFPTTSQRLLASSTSANDTALGTGIRTIIIEGLTGTYATQTETLSLSGTANVTTTNAFFRINRVRAGSAGSVGSAAGQIYLANITSTQRLASIETGQTQSRQLVYTVPYNQTLYTVTDRVSCGVGYLAGPNTPKTTYNIFTMRANYDGTATTTFFLPFSEIGLQSGSVVMPLELPNKYIGTTDIKMSVIGDVANSVSCQAAIRGWLE